MSEPSVSNHIDVLKKLREQCEKYPQWNKKSIAALDFAIETVEASYDM